MWLQLTSENGEPIDVNMDNVAAFYPYKSGTKGAVTLLESLRPLADGTRNYLVKETVDEIRAMLQGGATQSAIK